MDLSPLDRLLEQMRGDVIALQGDRVITHYADELEAALSTIRADLEAEVNKRVILESREIEKRAIVLRAENERLKAECRYEIEPHHFVRCPENHGSNRSLYDELTRLREALERLAADEHDWDGEDCWDVHRIARAALQPTEDDA